MGGELALLGCADVSGEISPNVISNKTKQRGATAVNYPEKRRGHSSKPREPMFELDKA